MFDREETADIVSISFDRSEAILEKHSVTISGHRTSISLERGFWRQLKRLAERDAVAVADLIRRLDEARTGSLSGAIRAYVLQQLEAENSALS